jgi:nitroreductase
MAVELANAKHSAGDELMDTSSLDFIKGRRTVRKFTGESISDEQLRSLLEAAVAAPTRYDIQPWHFVALRNKYFQRQVADTMRVHPYLENADVVVAVWGEPDRSPTWIMDGSAAIENLLLAAHAMGLGGAWAGGPGALGFEAAEALLRKEMDAPADVRLVSVVALGVPAETPPPHGKERWNRLRIHRGKFTDLWE